MNSSGSSNQLHSRVEQALRGLILMLGTWAIYSQIAIFARVPFTTLRLCSFIPVLAGLFLLRVTTPRTAFEWEPTSGEHTPSRWYSSPLLRFGGPLAAAAIFFFTKSEWLFWIAAAAVLTVEVRFAPAPNDVSAPRSSNLRSHMEVAGLALLCAIAAGSTAGLVRPDDDDAYFVNVATSVNEFPDQAPLSFDSMHRGGLPPVEQALHLPQTYEVLVGLVSSVSLISVPTLYYLVFPPLWAVLGTLAHWLVLRHLLPRREALLATAIWVFIIIFWGDGLRAFGSFGFARLFQGKAVFLVALAPLIVLAGLRYRERPGLATWICLALSQNAASALTTNAIIIGPLLAAAAIAARPRFDRSYLAALAGGAGASLPVLAVAALMHTRLMPFLTGADPDPFFTPYLTTLGWRRAPLVLVALLSLPVLAARARLTSAPWIRSYVWLTVVLVFMPVASSLATMALGNVFSWRIFWSVPIPLLVSLAGGIALGGLLDRRLVPEGAVIPWLVIFAVAAPSTFAQGSWSLRHYGRLKVDEPRYAAARAAMAVARTDAPALVSEAVAVYVSGMPGGPPLVGVRPIYLRKLWHVIPDADLARRLELFGYVGRGDGRLTFSSEEAEITRAVGGDPLLPFEGAMRSIDDAGIATLVFRESHPDSVPLLAALSERGFILHHVGGFAVAALPK
jgi:hypothetical protein